jgi:hypothetical protein
MFVSQLGLLNWIAFLIKKCLACIYNLYNPKEQTGKLVGIPRCFGSWHIKTFRLSRLTLKHLKQNLRNTFNYFKQNFTFS